MNKRIVSVFLISVYSILFASCAHHVVIGSGKDASEDRTVGAFDNIDISTSLHAIITVNPAAKPSLTLSGYQNILNNIKTEVKDNTLRIYTEDDIQFSVNKKTEAIITVPSLSAVSLSGAPDANLHGNIAGKSFKLDISGAAEVVIDSVNASDFAADLSGAGLIEVKGGNVNHGEFDISGAGTIKAFGLLTNETVASVSGAGSCDVNAQQKLDAHISGVGKVRYKGHPVISSHTSGVGGVSDAN
jgi:hypothetical protein